MESDQNVFQYSLLAIYLIGPSTAITLRFLQAPYGKHRRPGWGPTMAAPLAWFLMESPSLWLTLLLFPLGIHSSNPKSLALVCVFLLHYFNRTCLFPLRLHRRTAHQKIAPGFPVSMAVLAFGFNFLNSYLQTRWVSHYADYDGDEWFWWRFSVGAAVFFTGMAVNVWSDRVLVRLKEEAGGGYKVPRGGWFEVVSCPNYFGECVEWLGWALMTWSWTGLGFLLFT
ncbi:3-oxo-5-alpha-steroid 4-dehydrogenase, partial [Parasponia andersonii]